MKENKHIKSFNEHGENLNMSDVISSKTKVYFAHPINTYDTILEKFFLEYFSKYSDIEIVNPNGPEHQEGYKNEGMEYFKKLVQSCDKLYAFGFGDNTIGAGIAKEMDWMFEKGGTVIFLPFFSTYEEQTVSKCNRQFEVLSVEETRSKLRSY